MTRRFVLHINEPSRAKKARGVATESLMLPNGDVVRLPLFGLLGAFTRAFFPLEVISKQSKETPPPEAIWIALRCFVMAITATGDEFTLMRDREDKETLVVVSDKPYQSPHPIISLLPAKSAHPEDDHGSSWLWLECLSITFAVLDWLRPFPRDRGKGYFEPKEMFLRSDPQLPGLDFEQSITAAIINDRGVNAPTVLRAYRGECFRARTAEVSVEVTVKEEPKDQKSFSYIYSANGLLPLTWMEVLWAIENGKHARLCNNCGGAFYLRRPFKRKDYACSPGCAQALREDRAGGLDALRAANREAKQASRKRLAEGERKRKRGNYRKE